MGFIKDYLVTAELARRRGERERVVVVVVVV